MSSAVVVIGVLRVILVLEPIIYRDTILKLSMLAKNFIEQDFEIVFLFPRR